MTPEEIKADLLVQKRDIENGLKSGALSPFRSGVDWRGRLREIDQQLRELKK